LLAKKLDNLEKYVGKTKTLKNMPKPGVKVGK
jgi:hypothetical protein